jgi:Flp pilus assembly protein TadD
MERSRAVWLYNNKQYERALQELVRDHADPKEDPELAYYLGLVYTRLERYDEALLYLEQVVTAHENVVLVYQCRMILSYIYNLTGRYRLAQFELEQLKKNGFNSPQVYASWAFAAFSLHNLEESVDLLEEAFSLDPDNANVMNSLGYILAELNRDLDRALELCKRANVKKPRKAAYMDSLGWVYYKKGRFREAKTLLSDAFQLSHGDSTVAEHLKLVMEALGEK